ncbi:phage tail tape measure protein [Bartonella sp. LJL80]
MSLIETFTILFRADTKQAEDSSKKLNENLKTVTHSAQAVGQAFKGVVQRTTEMNGVVERSTRPLADTVQTIGKGLSSAAQTAKQSFQDVGSAASETAQALGNSFSAAVDSVGHAIASVGNGFHTALKSSMAKTLPQVKGFAKDLSTSFGNTVSDITGDVTNLFSFSGAFNAAMQQADRLDALGKIATQSRIGVKNLDLLSRAARSLGGDVGGAQKDISNFANSVSTALADKGSNAAAIFDKLGVSLTNQNGKIKNTGKLIGELSQKMRNIDQPQKMQMLNGLGIQDPGMRKYFMSTGKTQKRVMSEQKDNGSVTQKQVDIAREFKQVQNELKDTINDVATELFNTLGPALTEIFKRLKNFVSFAKDNKIVMVAFFGALAIAAASYAVSMGAAAMATLAATWPILAIVAAVAALGAVIYDVTQFMRGQPSVLGDLVAKYPALGQAIAKIGEAWEGLKARAEPVINFFKAVWGMITSAWSGDMEGMKKYAFDALNAIKQYFLNIWNDISAIVGKIVDWIQKQLWKMLPDWAKRWLGGEGDNKRAEVAAEEQRQQTAEASTAAAQQHLQQVGQTNVPANAAEIVKNQNIENNKNTNVQVGETYINVQTTAPAETIERELKNRDTKWINRTISNQDDSVIR